MNLASLLPSHAVAVECADSPEACAARLVKALTPADQASLIARRVRGVATAEGVNLWYSLRPRPARLAPQLFARWETDRSGTRLVGEIRQEPVVALRVVVTGAFLGLMLAWMAVRGALSWPFALAAAAALVAYPWIAWYIASGDIGKIKAFLQEQLGTRDAASST
ncbi:MAG: hypothetical protein MUC55_12410 [Burkholderiales bacterium]|nr:hypothetical protein [Burkholderiales bacterium]